MPDRLGEKGAPDPLAGEGKGESRSQWCLALDRAQLAEISEKRPIFLSVSGGRVGDFNGSMIRRSAR